jgi:hypothetical protein
MAAIANVNSDRHRFLRAFAVFCNIRVIKARLELILEVIRKLVSRCDIGTFCGY